MNADVTRQLPFHNGACLTTLTLGVQCSGSLAHGSTISILRAVASTLRTLRLNLCMMPYARVPLAHSIPATPELILPNLQRFHCHLGQYQWSDRLLLAITKALKPDQLKHLSLVYPGGQALPLEFVLLRCGKGLEALTLRTQDCRTISVDEAHASSNLRIFAPLAAESRYQDVKTLCPQLARIALEEIDACSMAYIAANVRTFRLDCQDLTVKEIAMLSLTLGNAEELKEIYLTNIGHREQSDRWLYTVRAFGNMGWQYTGLSACQNTVRFTRQQNLRLVDICRQRCSRLGDAEYNP